LDFKIADASAFYAGTPFRSLEVFYTTSQVYEEIKHIKKNYDVLGVLIESGRLKIRDPEPSNTDLVIKKSKETGDFSQLSKEDISILALCVDPNGEEWDCLDARITITTNSDGNICALQKGGSDGFTQEQLEKCGEISMSIGPKIREILKQAQEQHK